MTNENRKSSVKKVVALVLLGAAVSVSAVACGMHGKHMSEQMMRRVAMAHVDDLMDEIDADDAQRAQFEALAADILQDALAVKKAHKSDKKTLLASLREGKVDRGAIHGKLEAHLDLAEGFLSRSLDKVLDAYESLRKEQQQIIVDKLEEHMNNH